MKPTAGRCAARLKDAATDAKQRPGFQLWILKWKQIAIPPVVAYLFLVKCQCASLPSCYCCPRASLLRRCRTRLFVRRAGDWAGRSASSFTVIRPHVRRPISSHSPFRCGPPMTGGRRCGPSWAAVVWHSRSSTELRLLVLPRWFNRKSSFPVAFTPGSLLMDMEARLAWLSDSIKAGGWPSRIHSIDKWRKKACNQSMKLTAPLRDKCSLFAATLCLSSSR